MGLCANASFEEIKLSNQLFMKLPCCAVTCLIVASCHSSHDGPLHPQFPRESRSLEEAVTAFATLQDAGKLPGIGRGDHGRLETLPLPRDVEDQIYPQTVTLKVKKESAPDLILFYAFRKESARSQFNLVRVWQQNIRTGTESDLFANQRN